MFAVSAEVGKDGNQLEEWIQHSGKADGRLQEGFTHTSRLFRSRVSGYLLHAYVMRYAQSRGAVAVSPRISIFERIRHTRLPYQL